MATPFSDITLYTFTTYTVGTPAYWEVISLQNYVSDLYVRKMYGYKPPKATRVTIQPEFHGIWSQPNKFGSIFSIAPYYNVEEFNARDKKGKYQYILDLIQTAMLELSEAYQWDKAVFEKAYKETIESDFKFKIEYPAKLSRDRKKSANLTIEKTETITTVYSTIVTNETVLKIKLFEKKNAWWYDCAYKLCPFNKWIDNDRFGIHYGKGIIDIWYSLKNDKVELFQKGEPVSTINFKHYFSLQL